MLFESSDNKGVRCFAWAFILIDAALKLLKSHATYRIIISHQDTDA